jgi:hypothetical protein
LEIEMSTNVESPQSSQLIAAVCRELFALAKHEEDAACTEAAQVPYWLPCPPTVEGHRAAARALRADAVRLESEARRLPLAS